MICPLINDGPLYLSCSKSSSNNFISGDAAPPFLVPSQIDDCDEDVFPPEIDASKAIVRCGDLIFPTKEQAQSCFEDMDGLVTAIDDCKKTRIDFSSSVGGTSCSAIVTIKATALGCGERAAEDTTTLNVPVAICCSQNAIALQPGMGCNGVDDDCK